MAVKSESGVLAVWLTRQSLSAGQKQLVALARAMLKRQKALILDEATASIDSATDAEISRVVHQEFVGVTVLIIAHRLRVSIVHFHVGSCQLTGIYADNHALQQDLGDGQGEVGTAGLSIGAAQGGRREV